MLALLKSRSPVIYPQTYTDVNSNLVTFVKIELFTFVIDFINMTIKAIQDLFNKHKETHLFHRYITNEHIQPLLGQLGDLVKVEVVGQSVQNQAIYGLKVGQGKHKILMWSQMHGNESTTTKALFDLLNCFTNDELSPILEACTLFVIPILNPDGATAYTRINANKVDLNRDAQNLTQPESQVLRAVFDEFKPDFCFNLHGQRTIFSAGHTNKSAIVSFLAPAQDQDGSMTPNRAIAMDVIKEMNQSLQQIIPDQVGVYDDSFNINCVGDTFQSENIPTILFEAGHVDHDYARELTREYIFVAYVSALYYITTSEIIGENYKSYFDIPENAKCFFDVVIRNAKISSKIDETTCDIGVLFQEKLVEGCVQFVPKIDQISNLSLFYGHKEINANGLQVFGQDGEVLKMGSKNLFVIIDNDKIPLFSK